ncbi:MAG TPA: ABC transporter ATP-binding protein [Anaerolineae bacterium]|nr:ABC transporter ATP-binding protein [Anaerolineae bacterium]
MQKYSATPPQETILDVKNLRVHYQTDEGDVIAVNGVNFKVYKGELVGLVGESGCGKTTTAMGILRLVQPPGRIIDGEVIINGRTDLISLNEKELRQTRWTDISLVPQGAMNSLNPTMRVKDQIKDAIEAHEGKQPKREIKERILNLLRLVGLPSRIYKMYPHELSGGMKQRVCIAMAIALHPTLVIADEPTSALDVIVQRIVAQTLLDIKQEMGVSVIMIGHDMGLMAQMADRIAVMYAGNIVEIAPTKGTLKGPLHPYTRLLIEAVPSIKERKPLKLTEGLTHDLRDLPPGCIFQFRCPHVWEKCREIDPPLQEVNPRHRVACHLYQPEESDGNTVTTN